MTRHSGPDLGWLWLFGIVAVLAAASLSLGGDTIGAILLLLAFLGPLSSRGLRRDWRSTAAVMAVVAAHAAVAVINSILGVTLGADRDAASFHADASNVAAAYAIDPEMVVSYTNYGRTLGYVYHFLGTSHLLGNALSVLATSLACMLLVKVMREVELGGRASALVIFGLMPSGIMLASVTLREAYQQLALLLAIYATLQLRRRGWRWAPAVVATAGALAVLHNGLALYAAFLVMSALTWGSSGHGRGRPGRRLAGLVVASAILVFALSRSSGMAQSLDAVQNGQAFEYAETYRTRGEATDARTTYSVRLDASSPLRFAASLPFVFVEYMFAPFPWQVGNLLDVEAFAESVLRFALLVASFVTWRRARGAQRSQLGLLLWLYLSMELLWSLGTYNWGTAIRHHLPTLGILAATGGPLVLDKLEELAGHVVRVRRAA
jgi:hypothetical protein